MSPASVFLLAFGMLLCMLVGMAFHAAGSAVLRLNRARLLRLFSEGAAEIDAERAILRDTKDTYFVSRLGLAASLVGTAFCAVAMVRGILGLLTGGPGDATREIWEALIALALATPLFQFFVFGVPRLTMRRAVSTDEDYELPAWMSPFLRLVRPLAAAARVGRALPLGRLLPRHQLTKNDLVALVTDLDIDEEDEASDEERHVGANAHGTSNGDEEPDEEEIIYNILDLEETLVREVMKPINSVVAIRLQGATVDAVKDLARRTGYSRFPVFKDRIVNLAGYVSIYDILRAEGDEPLEAFVSPVYFVPEFQRVSRLLREFLDRRVKAAVVVDEHGGTSGWVTREDVFEEIVGEIEDEFDARRRGIEEVEDGYWLVEGDTDIDDLGEEIPVSFEEPAYDTIAGFILDRLGEIPDCGAVVETDEAAYRVEQVQGNRIVRVSIRLRDEDEEDSPKD